jgi:superfamily I DNA and/or RNA helicase
LAKEFIAEQIAPNHIIILSGYIAQTALIRKTIISLNNPDLEQVVVSTVDVYQGELSIATDKTVTDLGP